MTPPLETSIICRAAVAIPATVTGVMMYMPGGIQTITPIGGGIKQPISVLVDSAGAAELQSQLTAIAARSSKKPYFDFNHEDRAASFWPESFFWQDSPEPGIYCRGEWTASGKAAVEGKDFRQFSPVFHVDNKRGTPAHIVARDWAKPNMGGLVNDPAFHNISPLWAKNLPDGDVGDTTETAAHTNMTPEQIAALQAKNTELLNELTQLKSQQAAIKAKNESDALIAAQISAKTAEVTVNTQALEIARLQAQNTEQTTAIQARNKVDAEAAVTRAVNRGAIAAKDETTRTALVAKCTEDPAFIKAIDALPGAPALSGRVTPSAASSAIVVTGEAPRDIFKAYGSLVAKNATIKLSHETHKEKGRLAREAGAIFAKDIAKNDALADLSMEDIIAIVAADNSDISVGLLSGTLVLQRALPLLQYEYPMLGSITQDFSDAPGLLNQTESTRIIVKPAVQTYDTAVDSAGRPKGWDTVSPAQTVDVKVTLDEYVGVPIVFGNQVLAQTIRNLFAEQAPMALYAIGGYAVNKLTALITAANFNAYAGTTAGGGATTAGSTTITVTSTANMFPGQSISGTGLAANSYVASITDGVTAVVTQAAASTQAGPITFTLGGGKVPTTYATYVKALADFNMASLGDIASAFDTNEVPLQNRFALLNSTYFHRLAQDPTFNTFFAATQKPEIITEGALPKLQGFNPMKAPWFPTSNNRVGFAGHKASLILKSRLPQDFTSAVGAMVPGSVTTVTAPGGISVLLVQYVSLRENYAEWRPEVMLGAAVGDRRAGMVLTSQ